MNMMVQGKWQKYSEMMFLITEEAFNIHVEHQLSYRDAQLHNRLQKGLMNHIWDYFDDVGSILYLICHVCTRLRRSRISVILLICIAFPSKCYSVWLSTLSK